MKNYVKFLFTFQGAIDLMSMNKGAHRKTVKIMKDLSYFFLSSSNMETLFLTWFLYIRCRRVILLQMELITRRNNDNTNWYLMWIHRSLRCKSSQDACYNLSFVSDCSEIFPSGLLLPNRAWCWLTTWDKGEEKKWHSSFRWHWKKEEQHGCCRGTTLKLTTIFFGP